MAIMVRFQIGGHTAADWVSGDPVLLDREYAAETDTGKFKLGDGSTLWSGLPYQTFWSSFGRLGGVVGDNVALTDALAAKVGTSAIDTDTTLAANSDSRVASQKAAKAYIDAIVTGLFDLKSDTDCSANPNYPAGSKGDAHVVSVAGKIGGASGVAVDIGDVYVAKADNAGGTQASVGTSWFILEHNLAGALLAANNLSDLASASAALTNLGAGTGDSPQFAGVNIGHVSDTTVTRMGAGDIAVEGNALYRAGGTDVPLTDGGTGASTAPGARLNLGLGTVATLALDTDGTLAANSDSNVATQKAVKTYVDTAVTGLFDFKGSTNCSANPNYPAALKGDAYVVSAAGKIGGASGTSVDISDVYVASADNAGGTQASVGASWFVLEHNLVGALLAANNLSDVASAPTARANLGLVIGTDVEAHSATLTALAAATTWATWSPTFATDLGNAAFSFTGAATVTKARWSRILNTVTVLINFSVTLKAITPGRIDVSLPAGVTPVDASLYSPCILVHAGTDEAGRVRTNNAGSLLFYRPSFATFGSGATVSGLVSFSFEV